MPIWFEENATQSNRGENLSPLTPPYPQFATAYHLLRTFANFKRFFHEKSAKVRNELPPNIGVMQL